MLQVIDPSVTDEADPFSVDPDLDMYDPDNGWRPWPEPSSYDAAWLTRYRAAQRDRVARIDAIAQPRSADARRPRPRCATVGARQPRVEQRAAPRRARAVPHDLPHARRPGLPRPDASTPTTGRSAPIFAFPDPLDANYGYGGLAARDDGARVGCRRGRACRRTRAVADTMPAVDVPTLVVHPTGRHRDPPAPGPRPSTTPSGADDKEYVEVAGAGHYLHGHRKAKPSDAIVDVAQHARALVRPSPCCRSGCTARGRPGGRCRWGRCGAWPR